MVRGCQYLCIRIAYQGLDGHAFDCTNFVANTQSNPFAYATRCHSLSSAGVGFGEWRECACVCVRPQAVATWLWANYTFSQAPPGRRTLRANFDEAAVCLFQGTGQGHVLPLKTDPAVQHVPIARRRTLCYLLSSGYGVLAIHGKPRASGPPRCFLQ